MATGERGTPTMRSMELRVGERVVYRSSFDTKTGALARAVEVTGRFESPWPSHAEEVEVEKRFGRIRAHGDAVFSPVPEMVDISITDKCGFGCTYCYQDSRPDREHGSKELVETVLRGFDEPPYQIAIGGGEPTIHPDFEAILRTARAIGTVPNYTTAGHHMTDAIAKATNEVCGGVAMTYHAFKGIDWFVKHYRSLKEQLNVPLNVHLIADVHVVENLRALLGRIKETGPLWLVLLAYYPDVGRASLGGIMTKQVYHRELPVALRDARSAGYHLAFSEGLIPYFLSRSEAETGVNTRYALRSEGAFSCYFDPRGRIATSSFATPGMLFQLSADKNAFNTRSQILWNHMWARRPPGGEACSECRLAPRCANTSPFHYALCAFACHNDGPQAAAV